MRLPKCKYCGKVFNPKYDQLCDYFLKKGGVDGNKSCEPIERGRKK